MRRGLAVRTPEASVDPSAPQFRTPMRDVAGNRGSEKLLNSLERYTGPLSVFNSLGMPMKEKTWMRCFITSEVFSPVWVEAKTAPEKVSTETCTYLDQPNWGGLWEQVVNGSDVLASAGISNNFGDSSGIWPRLKRDRRRDGRSLFGPPGQLAKREQPGTGNEEERRRVSILAAGKGDVTFSPYSPNSPFATSFQ
ncbi:hypothetical protein DUI87_11999 [Hirundo rustica rustica]|uniref:Uncharacterized protein n=1 Tax=Hirundo rustica rustica TaxID=333673 RepID=A0A3M0KF99_HIRRU|nr:hypothetical protein DUI87_11999 [Hirundo rustica rustica]